MATRGETNPTLPAQRGRKVSAEAPKLRCVVVTDAGVANHTLHAGSNVVGRSKTADLHIDDESLSRRHAVLHVAGGVEIEDCGSMNGTRIGGRQLAHGERAPVQLGEPVELGQVTLLVQEEAVASAGPRRLWPHGYFEARLEEECARGERGTRFGNGCVTRSTRHPSNSGRKFSSAS